MKHTYGGGLYNGKIEKERSGSILEETDEDKENEEIDREKQAGERD